MVGCLKSPKNNINSTKLLNKYSKGNASKKYNLDQYESNH